jgi:polyisoprenoid-binding protein YceI
MSGTATLQPQTTTRWRLDPERSRVEFRVPNLWGLTTVNGRFDRYDGTLSLAERPAIELAIDAGSLNTANARRDKHLRSAAFFDAERHPRIEFVSQRAGLRGERLHVRGLLSAAGKSVSIELDASAERDGDELVVDATVQLDQRRLGMDWSPLGVIRAPAELTVHGRLVHDA